jgi:hypothetical protein
VRISLGKHALERLRRRQGNNIKIDLLEMGSGDGRRMELV